MQEETIKKSEYEQTRERNISRNIEFLKDIGLLDETPLSSIVAKPVALKRKKHCDSLQPPRKSSRLSGDSAASLDRSYNSVASIELDKSMVPRLDNQVTRTFDVCDSDGDEGKKINVEELMQYISDANQEHYNNTSSQLAFHTLHRLNGMTSKQLLNRMTKITNTQKMIVFYYALKCADFTRLAECAKHILKETHNIDIDGSCKLPRTTTVADD